MDTKSIGKNLALLRRKSGLTQAQVAEKLNVSDKTVSKWESGHGFPEITQFPALSELFGVSIDYLMRGERRGIVIAGNALVDIVKTIDVYPKVGMLASISSVSRAVGGCVPNVGIDLAKIDRSIPITAAAKVGDDEYGRYLVSKLGQYGIDTKGVSVSGNMPTGFSDVMSLPSGDRTFFHARGANAEFGPDDIELDGLDCSILHIGYIMLLDTFDQPDEEYGTVMARFLHDVKGRGIKTSVDVVSSSTLDYGAMIRPALKYSDYLVINEIECCGIWGLEPYTADGKLNIENIKKAIELTAAEGVSEKIVVHSKSAGWCYDVPTSTFTFVPSLEIPKEQIKGSVGAGDAYCAGCLYGIYNGYDDKLMLEFASAAAACNLFAENSIDGMREKKAIMQMLQEYKRKQIKF